MNYRLIVLTHGPNLTTLTATLDAFFEHVSPAPVDVYLAGDGEKGQAAAYEYAAGRGAIAAPGAVFVLGGSYDPLGFCEATRAAWNEEGAQGPHDFVFWLEHDFVIERDVDLAAIAAVLQEEPTLAQMALMRDAVNEQEKAAGGLYESRRAQYVPRWIEDDLAPNDPDAMSGYDPGEAHWLEHRAYLTTNPSLMRRAFMQHNPWPDYEAECEGRFGIDLVLRGYSFGVWGDGRPWCRHIGDRNGFGY